MHCETKISRDGFGNITSRLVIKADEGLDSIAFIIRHIEKMRSFYENEFCPKLCGSGKSTVKTLAVYYTLQKDKPTKKKNPEKYFSVIITVSVYTNNSRDTVFEETHHFEICGFNGLPLYKGEARQKRRRA